MAPTTQQQQSATQKSGVIEEGNGQNVDMMSCHVYAKSHKDPLLAFTNCPSQRELIAQFGTDAPVKYIVAIPDAARLSLNSPSRPLIFGCPPVHPQGRQEQRSDDCVKNALPSGSGNYFDEYRALVGLPIPSLQHLQHRPLLQLPEYVEPVKGPSKAKKRRSAGPPMNADHERSEEYVLPPSRRVPTVSSPAISAGHLNRLVADSVSSPFLSPPARPGSVPHPAAATATAAPTTPPFTSVMLNYADMQRMQQWKMQTGSQQIPMVGVPSPIVLPCPEEEEESDPRSSCSTGSSNGFKREYDRLVAEHTMKERLTGLQERQLLRGLPRSNGSSPAPAATAAAASIEDVRLRQLHHSAASSFQPVQHHHHPSSQQQVQQLQPRTTEFSTVIPRMALPSASFNGRLSLPSGIHQHPLQPRLSLHGNQVMLPTAANGRYC